MKISQDNSTCFEDAEFEQCTFSEHYMRLYFNGNFFFFIKLMKTFCFDFEKFRNLQRS